jgi:hypothetical protein
MQDKKMGIGNTCTGDVIRYSPIAMEIVIRYLKSLLSGEHFSVD